MRKLYSETGSDRLREIVADVATPIWLVFWFAVGFRIQETISRYAGMGRTLRDGGTSIQGAGAQIGDVLNDVPLVGPGIDALTTGAFGAAGTPFVDAGNELESLVLLIARLIAILVIAVFVLPWLFKYVPWRMGRIRSLRAAEQAIRRGPLEVSHPAMQHALAMRAINRLSYEELLEHTPDPFGDFAAGRFDRLAKAELANAGLG
jgi:hypothetical protein